MDHVRWIGEPSVHRPYVIAAFEGWNDAGDAATLAGRWIRDRWAPEPVGEIDPEEFYDFTSVRPKVRLCGGMTRAIEWPCTRLTGGSGAGVDTVVILGTEPQLRWRRFCDQVVAVARHLDARLVVTLGSLLAEVPHTHPTAVIGTAGDDDLIERLNLRRSTYEGPTGIVGVLHDSCARAGLASASLWAAVPTYVPGAPSPKAALALVERTAALLGVPVTTTDLEIAAAAYERQVSQVVEDDQEMTGYVRRLEERCRTDDDGEADGSLADEVERYLRGQR